MIVLGIDPGTAICGYGLVEIVGNHIKVLDYGAITTDAKMKPEDRLLKIHRELSYIIEKYKPEIMGVEQLFFNKNIKTAIPVGQARGVVLLCAAQHNLKLVEQTPIQIKQSVVGYGRATKEQVIYMVTKLLNLKAAPKPDDVADALAVAICTTHLVNSVQYRNTL